MTTEHKPHSVLDEARSFFEGTTERPLDHVEALAWDLLGQLAVAQQEAASCVLARDVAVFEAHRTQVQFNSLLEQFEECRSGYQHQKERAERHAATRKALEEQLETLRTALERIANDATPMGFKIIAREALEQTSIPAKSRLCPEHGIPDCSPLLNGCSYFTRKDSAPARESVLERKAREERESLRGAPPSVLPDPDIDLSSPASVPHECPCPNCPSPTDCEGIRVKSA